MCIYGDLKLSRAPRGRKINLIFSWWWRRKDVLMAFPLRPRRCYGTWILGLRSSLCLLSRSYRVLVGDWLRYRGASTAYMTLSRRSHCAFMAIPRRSNNCRTPRWERSTIISQEMPCYNTCLIYHETILRDFKSLFYIYLWGTVICTLICIRGSR